MRAKALGLGGLAFGAAAGLTAWLYLAGEELPGDALNYAVQTIVLAAITAIVFGVVVPRSASREGPPRAAVPLAILAVASVAVYWSGLPVVLGTAALLLVATGTSKPRAWRHRLVAVAGVVGLAGGVAAGVSDGLAPSEDSKPQAVTIVADDAAWQTTGTTGLRSGWVTFTMTTRKGKADHGLQLVRLRNGASIEDALKEEDVNRFLQMAEPMGGFVGIGEAETHRMTVRLRPGRYAIADFGEMEGQGPNFARGMTATFEVDAGEKTAGRRPTTEGEIVMREYAIDLPAGFDGRGTYRVRNAGSTLHELGIGRLDPGADALAEIRRHAETGHGRMTEVTGVGLAGPGTDVYVDLALPAGSYAFVCFFGEPPDEKPHALKGMYRHIVLR